MITLPEGKVYIVKRSTLDYDDYPIGDSDTVGIYSTHELAEENCPMINYGTRADPVFRPAPGYSIEEFEVDA